jgi:translocon-associated protein subunit delta
MKLIAAFAFILFSMVSGETCQSPQVKVDVYTTPEVHVSTETVVIITFSLQCKNGVKDLNLYAEFDGRNLPASRVLDSDQYQVSFSVEHKKMPAGQYKIRFFDEELYGSLRKAQRSGEDTSSVESLFTIDFSHQGASQGPWIQTEHIAVGTSLLVSYFAYTTRNHLQS